MARYEITAPDGARYEITAPDDASEQDVMQYAQQQFAQSPRVRPDPIERPGAIERPGTPGRTPQRQQRPPSRLEQDMLQRAPVIDATPAPPAVEQQPGRFGFVPPGVKMAESQPVPPPDTGSDILKSFGAGVVRGGIGLASLPATAEQLAAKGGEPLQQYIPEGVRQVGSKIADAIPFPFSLTARQFFGGPTNKPTQEGITKTVEGAIGPLHQPQTMAGEYARTVGEFVPGAATPGGLMRKAANVVLPGVASEAAGQATKGSDFEPAARVAGGLAGTMLPNIAMRGVTPFPNPYPERARQARIMDREGVPLTAGERTGSKAVRWAESTANDVPLSGHRIGAQKDLQAEKFTQAAMKRAGISNATRATDRVVDDAFERLGKQFDEYASRVAIPPNPRTRQALERIVKDYERTVEPANLNPLPKSILDDFSNANGLTGRQYLQWRSDIGRIARGTPNPFTRDTLYDLQRTLDDAAESMLRQTGRADLAKRMSRTRKEYRNLLMVAEARAGAGENAALGLISPQKLQEVARRFEGRTNYARGKGDMTTLANAGVATMFPLPNSGTPARLAAQGLFMLPGTIAGTMGTMSGGPAGGALAAAGAALSQGTMARMLMSKPVQSYLGNQTLTRAIQNSRARTPIAIGALPGTIERDKKR